MVQRLQEGRTAGLSRPSLAGWPPETLVGSSALCPAVHRLRWHILAGVSVAALAVRTSTVVRRAASAKAEAAENASKDDGWATALDVAKAVLLALLDIFKAPPEEATGKDAPGLVALAPGGVPAAISGCQVVDVSNGSKKDAAELLEGGGSRLLVFTTHFGDFNSWEVLQQLRTAFREERLGGAKVLVVGIGKPESGKKLADFLELPAGLELFADPTGACHRALNFSRGALPQYAEQLNPYFRVFLMLLGVGSPGTIRTVLSGYFGNSSLPKAKSSWVDEALKQGAAQGRFPTRVPQRLPWEEAKPGAEEWVDLAQAGSAVWDDRGFGETGLRPFELATVRLQNMVSGIIGNWNDLKPPDDELLVQQGGAVVWKDGEAAYFYRDKGILTYVPVEDALAVARGDP